MVITGLPSDFFRRWVTVSFVAKICLSVLTFLLFVDYVRHGSVVSQYLHLVSFGFVAFFAAKVVDYLLEVNLDRDEGNETSIKIRDSLKEWTQNIIQLGLPISQSKQEVIKKTADLSCAEDQVELFVDEIFHRYISFWSRNFPGKSRNDEIGQHVRDALRRLLNDLVNSLKHLDLGLISIGVLHILRDHVSRLQNSTETFCETEPKQFEKHLQQNFPFKHKFQNRSKIFNSISRYKYVETMVLKLLFAFNAQKRVPSQLVFSMVAKIITQQVVLNLVERFSNPAIIHTQFLVILKPEQFPELPQADNDVPTEPSILDENPEPILKDKVLTDVEVIDKLLSSDAVASMPVDTSCGQIYDQTKTNPARSRVNTLDLTGYKVRPAVRDSTIPSFQTGSGKISSALGSLFSATAGPLLPDNIAFLPFNKMWKSPSKESCPDKIFRKQYSRKMSDDSITSVDAKGVDHCENNNEEPSEKLSPSKFDLLSKGESSIMSVCQSLSDNFDLFITGKSQIVPKTEGHILRRHSHQLGESSSPSSRHPHIGDIYSSRTRPEFEKNHIKRSLSHHSLPLNPKANDLNQNPIYFCNLSNQNPIDEHLSLQPDSFDLLTLEKSDVNQNKDFVESIQTSSSTSSTSVDENIAYEDNEDLESTIRKLRQLLSQKTGESSSTESFKMHCQPVKPDEIAIPSDGRLFVNITIPEMETVQTKENATTRKDVLFCVHYDGIYLEQNPEAFPSGPRPDERKMTSGNYRYVMRGRTVKRRRKDFQVLNGRLENCRKCSKLPEINRLPCEEGKDEDRARLDLEKWLISLAENPNLASNPDLKEFLAYESEENFGFSIRSGGAPVPSAVSQNPRIDKFAKKVSGMFHTIKDALPTFEEGQMNLNLSGNNNNDQAENSNSISRSFLFPGFLSSSTCVSPHLSPSVDSRGGVCCVDARDQQDLQNQIRLNFLPKNSEKSDFETILDFHLLHLDQLLLHFGSSHSSDVAHSKNSSKIRNLDDNIQMEEFSKNLIQFILIDLPPPKLVPKWISKDITQQLANAILGETIDNAFKQLMDQLNSEGGWNETLSWVRTLLWPKETKIEKESKNNEGSDAFSLKMRAVFQILGMDVESLESYLKNLTINPAVNEDCILSIFDLLLANILKGTEKNN